MAFYFVMSIIKHSLLLSELKDSTYAIQGIYVCNPLAMCGLNDVWINCILIIIESSHDTPNILWT